jgi:hypothetical protein
MLDSAEYRQEHAWGTSLLRRWQVVPIGKVLDGDDIEITIDRLNLTGTIELVGDGEHSFLSEGRSRLLRQRPPRSDRKPHPQLPSDMRLWAALVQACGCVWNGCVYDTDAIIAKLE